MNQHSFANIFSKMIAVYGNKAYPEERIGQFYEAFKSWDEDLFEKAVKMAIAESMTPPPLSRFVELVFAVRKEQYQRDSALLESKLEHAPDCGVCDKKGSFVYQYFSRQNNRFYKAAFSCRCEAGKIVSPFSKAPLASQEMFRFMQLKEDAPLWETTVAMMDKGFWHESLIAARIVNAFIKNGDNYFLGFLLHHFKITEEDFLEINHEFKSGKPGKWNEFFKQRGFLLNYREINLAFLGRESAGHVQRRSHSDQKAILSNLIGRFARDANEIEYDT